MIDDKGVVTNTFHDATYSMWYSPCKIGRAFRSGTPYELPFLQWIYDQEFEGVALDIGANIGNHTLWMALVCDLDVTAFEPVLPHVVRANAELNGVLGWGVHVYDCALGDVPSTAHHKAKGVIVPGTSEQSTDETFEIKRLDDLGLTERTAFWKVDVEGFEPQVLLGGRNMIMRDQPVIACEQWGPAADKAVEGVLRPLGYHPDEKFGGRGKAPMTCWRPTSA